MERKADAKLAQEVLQLQIEPKDVDTPIRENANMDILGGRFRFRLEAHIVRMRLDVILNCVVGGVFCGV